MVTSSAMGIS
jgi:predicted ATP-dependent serine protease